MKSLATLLKPDPQRAAEGKLKRLFVLLTHRPVPSALKPIQAAVSLDLAKLYTIDSPSGEQKYRIK